MRAEPVRNVWGNNMAIRREVFDMIGGFRLTLGKLALGQAQKIRTCAYARPPGMEGEPGYTSHWGPRTIAYQPNVPLFAISRIGVLTKAGERLR